MKATSSNLSRRGRIFKAEVIRAGARGALDRVARYLRQGRLVAFPTETVYGLGVRAGDRRAARRMARAKLRAPGKPFQLLIGSRGKALELCGRLPPVARLFAAAFWPGPLTIVLKDRRGRWVGLRMPAHSTALQLVRRAGGALAATSANLSGRRPARTAAEVLDAVGDTVDVILDGGPAALGRPSSVVRVRADSWEILRVGALSRRRLTEAAGASPRDAGERK